MLSEMDWLPTPSADFRFQTQALEAAIGTRDTSTIYEEVLSLATAALDETQLGRLARLSTKLQELRAGSPFVSATLALVGDGTLSLCAAPITATALRHGLLLRVISGEYGSALQEALDPSSAIHQSKPDMVVIASDRRALGLDVPAASPEDAARKVEAALSRVRTTAEGLSPSVKSAIVVQTLTPPLEALFGSFDRLAPGSPFMMVAEFNRSLARWAEEGSVVLADVARLAMAIGLETWDDPGHWHASKLSFAPRLIPVYSDLIARTLAAVRGRSRKCLVLDLDNTVWGGVVGDDGLAGIVLGQGSAAGEAYLAIQRMALDLRARGVILAVCSKNEDETARLPFRAHPEMLLKEDHIAVFQANWTDKAANLRAIAETLNIGLDSLVFLDDNPAERLQVRRELPVVAVPELPADPSLYPRVIAAAGYFETTSFSEEDRARAELYQKNAQRAAALSASGNIEDYLSSLEMTCTIREVDSISRSRVAQLTNKTNQYNLTTRRYSEREIESFERDPTKYLIQGRLTDRFGDNGIISVVIVDKSGVDWKIDTWLMSCRVLGRRVPEAILAHLTRTARKQGAERIWGEYIPSSKNKMVAEHYAELGFTQVSVDNDGSSRWVLDLLHAPKEIALPMKVDDFEEARQADEIGMTLA